MTVASRCDSTRNHTIGVIFWSIATQYLRYIVEEIYSLNTRDTESQCLPDAAQAHLSSINYVFFFIVELSENLVIINISTQAVKGTREQIFKCSAATVETIA